MKTRYHITLLAVALTASAMGQTTTWYFDTTNNSAAAGVTPNASVNIGAAWQDTFLSQLNPATAQGTSGISQANPRADFLGDGSIVSSDQNWQIWSFGNLGITDTINSAVLWLSARDTLSGGSFPAGQTNTWTIYGFNQPVNQATMTWNSSVGGVVTGSNYGTFNITGGAGGAVPGFTGVNITSALQAYNAGTITGIVIGRASPLVGSLDGTDVRIVFDTSESATAGFRPGLAVTTTPIPEPSAALLSAMGALALLRRKRK
jgi:hypothetical protein